MSARTVQGAANSYGHQVDLAVRTEGAATTPGVEEDAAGEPRRIGAQCRPVRIEELCAGAVQVAANVGPQRINLAGDADEAKHQGSVDDGLPGADRARMTALEVESLRLHLTEVQAVPNSAADERQRETHDRAGKVDPAFDSGAPEPQTAQAQVWARGRVDAQPANEMGADDPILPRVRMGRVVGRVETIVAGADPRGLTAAGRGQQLELGVAETAELLLRQLSQLGEIVRFARRLLPLCAAAMRRTRPG